MPTKTIKPKANGNPPAPPPDVLTLDAAAAFLHVSADGLRADAENGLVPGRKVGGEWRFSRGGLLAWLAGPSFSASSLPPAGGVGRDYHDEDPEEVIAEIRRRRKTGRAGAKP